jgi:hypothetical protein
MGQTYPQPLTAAMLAVSNANAGKPRYTSMNDWLGGVGLGEDPGLPGTANEPFNSASVAVADASGGANQADYAPRNLNAKRTAANMGAPSPGFSVDTGRNRGSIAPRQRYPEAGDAALAAPVVASLTPNTAVAVTGQPLTVIITGTGFTPYSRVISGGGVGSPWDSSARYISATQLAFLVDPRSATAGAISVAVEDHGVLSNTSINFTFT